MKDKDARERIMKLDNCLMGLGGRIECLERDLSHLYDVSLKDCPECKHKVLVL